jgi:sterol desaturase/sphingolipid hydroxylase (fatty acid hydroxylase superfamily)
LQFLQGVVTSFKSDSALIWFFAFWSVLAILGALEALIPGFHQAPERRHRWPTNFSLGFVNATLVPLAPVSAVGVAGWAYAHSVGLLNQIATPWWIAMMCTLAVRSFAGYAVHLLMHKAPLLWRVHRVHHFDTHLDISTSLRSHPAEYVISLLIIAPIAVALGLTASVLVLYELADLMVSMFSHANVRMPERLDRRLRWVLVTPNMHSIHHSAYRPETDSNYGTVFTIWDRLFGTYCETPLCGYDGLQIGLIEIRDQRTRDLWWQLKSPAIRIVAPSVASPKDIIENPAMRRAGQTSSSCPDRVSSS